MAEATEKRKPKERAAEKVASTTEVEENILAEEGSAVEAARELPDPSIIAAANQVLGQISWLMMRSPTHRHLFLSDLEWLLMPPLLMRQFRIFRQNRLPVGFVSWARLSEDAEKRFTANGHRLRPGDWNSGDRPWIVDVVAPFGGASRMLRSIREGVFPEAEVKVLARTGNGAGPQVAVIRDAQKTNGGEPSSETEKQPEPASSATAGSDTASKRRRNNSRAKDKAERGAAPLA